jgi:hypothetical protein
MKQRLRLFAVVMVTVALLVSFAGCAGAETPAPTTPAPTTTPTATPTPTPTATTPTTPEKPAVPEPAEPTLAATIFGQPVKIGVDADGALREDYTITTPDGSVNALFRAGTTLKDRDGNTIPELTVVIVESPKTPEDGAKVIGPALTFYPDLTEINPPLEYSINYAAFKDTITTVPDAEVKVNRFVNSRDRWAAIYDATTDSAGMTATTLVSEFTVEYTIGLVAATPKQVVRADGPPSNGIDIVVEDAMEYGADKLGELKIKTTPNAYVLCWMVNPGTASRSSRPDDRFRQADADGRISWEFTISRHVSNGEGHFEFYVTTNPDESFLEVFKASRLDTLFPDRAAELKSFKGGLIEQIVIDDQTTLKMYPYVVTEDGGLSAEAPAEPVVPVTDDSGSNIPLEMTFITPYIETEKEIVITVKTLPGATVFLQPLNPGTGTRSAWPKFGDGGKVKTADADGMVTWSWTLFRAVGVGDGVLEVLVTTSTDETYLSTWKESMSPSAKKQLAATRADTIYQELTWTVDKSNY